MNKKGHTINKISFILFSEKQSEANYQVPICETCRTITLGPVETLMFNYFVESIDYF